MEKARIAFEVDGFLSLLQMELDSFATLMAAGLVRKAGHSQYYAAYNACCALLASLGIKTESHAGAQSMISLHFVKSGKLPRDTGAKLNALMGQRHAIDYHAEVEIGYDEVAVNHAWLMEFVGSVLKLVEESKLASKNSLAAARRALQGARTLPPRRAGLVPQAPTPEKKRHP
jgi:uncharacterized protein (UPF0332 family)